jgi:hypothetical protein
MEKMIFDKEETRNLMSMLQSEDTENHVIAFKSLSNVDFNKYVGELLVLYKFANKDSKAWEDAGTVGKKLLKIVDTDKSLTSPRTLSLITANKGSKASIELFMESFVRDMTRMLESIGYPTDKIEIDIKLKE